VFCPPLEYHSPNGLTFLEILLMGSGGMAKYADWEEKKVVRQKAGSD